MLHTASALREARDRTPNGLGAKAREQNAPYTPSAPTGSHGSHGSTPRTYRYIGVLMERLWESSVVNSIQIVHHTL